MQQMYQQIEIYLECLLCTKHTNRTPEQGHNFIAV
jgi:hypothetical protein